MTTITTKKAKSVEVGDVGTLIYEGQKELVYEYFRAAEVDYVFGSNYSVRIVWRAIDDAAKKLQVEYYPDDLVKIVTEPDCRHTFRRWLDCEDCRDAGQSCAEVVCADCGESC